MVAVRNAGPAASHYPSATKEPELKRRFKFSLDDRPRFKNSRRAARRSEVSAPTVDPAVARRQPEQSCFFFLDKGPHASFQRMARASPRSTARLDNSDIADALEHRKSRERARGRRDSPLPLQSAAQDAHTAPIAAAPGSLEQSGADQDQERAGEDYPMQSERSGAGLRLGLPREEREEPDATEGAQPLASNRESLLNALSDVVVNDKDDVPNQVIPNIEVKYNSRSRRKASPLNAAKQSHEPVKQTLLRLPSPGTSSMPLASWLRSKPLRDL